MKDGDWYKFERILIERTGQVLDEKVMGEIAFRKMFLKIDHKYLFYIKEEGSKWETSIRLFELATWCKKHDCCWLLLNEDYDQEL